MYTLAIVRKKYFCVKPADINESIIFSTCSLNTFVDLQKSFDAYRTSFYPGGWYSNASNDAVLAYKLIIQTGDINHPIDESRINTVKLVSDDRVISPDAFYNYLTAWIYNDPFTYDLSQATIRPLPKEWFYVPHDKEDLLIPRASAITFARAPFYLHNLGDTQEILKTINDVRDICDEYSELGLKSYPAGIVFTFWEQYLHIHIYLLISLCTALLTIFIIISVALMSPLSALLVTITLTIITCQLFGLMGLVGIKLSAIPAVILVMSVGVGVEFTLHILSGYLTCVGNRVLRVKRSILYMFTPVVHGAVSTLLGVIMLAVSEFDFIVRLVNYMYMTMFYYTSIFHG